MTRPRIVARALNDVGPDRPVLVFGPSLGVSAGWLWDPVVAVLGDRCRAVGWDLPGHGASPPAAAAFSVDDLADAVGGVVTDLARGGVVDPRPPLHYVGSGLGAVVGLSLAARCSPFDSLVVTSVGTGVGDRNQWAARAREARDTGMRRIVRGAAEQWFGLAYRAARPDRTHSFVHEVGSVDPASYAWCCEVLATYGLEGGGSAVPVSGIWGELDRATPPRSVDGLRALWPGLVDHTVTGAAHLVPVERPGTVAHVIAEACLATVDTCVTGVG